MLATETKKHIMEKRNSPTSSAESNTVYFDLEDKKNIGFFLISPSPNLSNASNSKNGNQNATCLNQLENWSKHGKDPQQAISLHLSQSNKEAGLTEKPSESGGSVVCFGGNDASSKKINHED